MISCLAFSNFTQWLVGDALYGVKRFAQILVEQLFVGLAFRPTNAAS
jgi:hypothetical protein